VLQVVKRKHDRTEKANVFQKRLVWDYLYKEEFVAVMMILSEPTAVDKQKRMEADLFKVFQEFDEDRGGTIDSNELGKAMEKMGR
jgi:Ca2+-binding EF-hand superfamily protein